MSRNRKPDELEKAILKKIRSQVLQVTRGMSWARKGALLGILNKLNIGDILVKELEREFSNNAFPEDSQINDSDDSNNGAEADVSET